jgi:hypothetical protein
MRYRCSIRHESSSKPNPATLKPNQTATVKPAAEIAGFRDLPPLVR